MTDDDVLFAYHLHVLASARELGSVAAACRLHGIHRSTPLTSGWRMLLAPATRLVHRSNTMAR